MEGSPPEASQLSRQSQRDIRYSIDNTNEIRGYSGFGQSTSLRAASPEMEITQTSRQRAMGQVSEDIQIGLELLSRLPRGEVDKYLRAEAHLLPSHTYPNQEPLEIASSEDLRNLNVSKNPIAFLMFHWVQ